MLHVEARRYAPKNLYYLQVRSSAYKQLTKHRKELERKLAAEQMLEKRDELRVLIAEVRREQAYFTDYVRLRTEDIPEGGRIRDMARKPSKEVAVTEEVYQWLLQRMKSGCGNQG